MSDTRPPIQDLADALQRCFDSAVEQGAKRTEERIEAKWGPRFDRMDTRLDRMDTRLDRMDTRLDRQDDTLRLMWKQMKGNGSLPIDG